jgi:cytochrome o ubiquinol oxidase operon protein cyoD
MSIGHNPSREERAERREYLTGFILAILLSIIPFALVMWGGWDRASTLIAIAAFATVQMIVHFRYFLHLDLRKTHRDDLLLVLFTAIIVFLMAGGTIWVITNQMSRM